MIRPCKWTSRSTAYSVVKGASLELSHMVLSILNLILTVDIPMGVMNERYAWAV